MRSKRGNRCAPHITEAVLSPYPVHAAILRSTDPRARSGLDQSVSGPTFLVDGRERLPTCDQQPPARTAASRLFSLSPAQLGNVP